MILIKYIQNPYKLFLHFRILLSYGADVNGKNEKGQTPLFYASMARSSANIIELLNYGHADVNIEANNRKTALSKSRSVVELE